MKNRLTRLLIVIAALALASASAFATGTATTTMGVSADVNASCTISAAPLAFGSYNPTSVLDATATLTVNCTNGSSTVITIDQGGHPAGGSSDISPLRQMIKGSDYLRYDLYSDNARATIWGGTGAGYSGYIGTGTSGTVTVYGRVAASQNAPVGSYSDSVTVTITF